MSSVRIVPPRVADVQRPPSTSLSVLPTARNTDGSALNEATRRSWLANTVQDGDEVIGGEGPKDQTSTFADTCLDNASWHANLIT
mmetsp:Transcript_2014/g.6013  ORF Transcript_2014/g.6013 Transcript_2014/m.6013 type:complete len:85 (-) Transcript_2014:1177-1431(-)